MRRVLIFSAVFFLLFAGFVLPVFSQTPDLSGTWQMKPLLTKGASAPDNAGTFQEFGDTYVMENFVVFWGRLGGGPKDWALFSLKDGKVSRILTSDIEFTAPDGRKITVSRVPGSRLSSARAILGREQKNSGPTAVIRAGKRTLYISTQDPDHVYGWNGETLTRVLGGGEFLKLDGVPYQVKRATVLDVDRSGQALLYWDASKPEAEGWALHDGANVAALWKEGDTLPGRPAEERIKNLSSGPFCNFKCVPTPRLLPDGSLMAVVETTASRTSLVRISRDKTEILEGSPRKILAVEERDYVADVSKEARETHVTAFQTEYYKLTSFDLLLRFAGNSYQQEGVPVDLPVALLPRHSEHGLPIEVLLMPEVRKILEDLAKRQKELGPFRISAIDTGNVKYGYDDAVFLAPGSPRALVTLWVSTVERKSGWTKAEISAMSLPGLYFLDDHGLRRIAWESALGLDLDAAQQALTSASSGLYVRMNATMGDVLGERIRLHKLDGPVPGVQVELPQIGSGVRRWFVPAASADGKLERGPKFNVSGRTVTIADVLAWKGPDTALVGLEDGYFTLERVAEQ